jgi:hypothetical protein
MTLGVTIGRDVQAIEYLKGSSSLLGPEPTAVRPAPAFWLAMGAFGLAVAWLRASAAGNRT